MKLDATYTTPDQAHAMMEPHASIAAWEGDKLTLWTANQMVAWAVGDLAKTLGIPKENVRVVSPYIGGGFGGKLFLRSDAILAALGARAVGRPVKIALPRPFMTNNTTHRPATIQRMRLGASKDGKLTAFGHEAWSGDLPGGGPEASVMSSRLLYAAPNRMTTTRLAVLDLPEGNAMRAPGDAPGSMAFEIAMDEMAEKLKLDPDRIPRAQRHAGESRETRAALLAAAFDAVLPHGRREVRLEPPQAEARAGARRRVAGRHRRGHGVPRQPGHEIRGARAAR